MARILLWKKLGFRSTWFDAQQAPPLASISREQHVELGDTFLDSVQDDIPTKYRVSIPPTNSRPRVARSLFLILFPEVRDLPDLTSPPVRVIEAEGSQSPRRRASLSNAPPVTVSIPEPGQPPRRRLNASLSNAPPNRVQKKKRDVRPAIVHRQTSYSWKSETVKERDNFERVTHRVKHLAPRLFPTLTKSGKPLQASCGIFPQNFDEWKQHRLEILKLAKEEEKVKLERLIAQAEARRNIHKDHRQIRSAFEPDAKALNDGRSLVLAQRTIWTGTPSDVDNSESAEGWPAWVDLPSNDEIKNQDVSRRLPQPRNDSNESVPFRDRSLVVAHPLDRTGLMLHLYEVDMRDVAVANAKWDKDRNFKHRCRQLLGSFTEALD